GPPPYQGPTIGPASPSSRPMPLTGLCRGNRISCQAEDVITRATFPDRAEAIRLEIEALRAFCVRAPDFDPEQAVYRENYLRMLAERRVDDYIAFWRDIGLDRPVIGPCPPP